MNPSPQVLEIWGRIHAEQDRVKAEQRARLHKAAIERRRKAKRGGKR